MNPITITIPAAGTQAGVFTVHARGKYFLVTATNGTFRVLTSHGEEYSFSESNSGFGNDQSPTFGKLTFYNDSGATVQITFYVSDSPIKTADVNVTSNVNVTAVLTNTLAGCAPAAVAQFVVTANATVVNAFTAGSTPFRKVLILAFKTLAGGANAGIVNIGVQNGANQQPIALNPGDSYTFEAPTGAAYNLNNFFFVTANNGDGIVCIYS